LAQVLLRWDFQKLRNGYKKKIIIFEDTWHNNGGCHGDLRVCSFDNEM